MSKSCPEGLSLLRRETVAYILVVVSKWSQFEECVREGEKIAPEMCKEYHLEGKRGRLRAKETTILPVGNESRSGYTMANEQKTYKMSMYRDMFNALFIDYLYLLI